MTRNAAAYFLCLFFFVLAANAYNPPIGIPNPKTTWGELDPIDAAKPTATTYAPGWFEPTPRANSIAAGDAHDCYYIDNSVPGATDTSNTYGYPGHPRLTIPNIVYSAGSYVEVHGDGATGIYKYSATFNPRGVGTASAPIWIVGVNKPILSGALSLGTSNTPVISYMLFDGLYWQNGGWIDVRPRFAGNTMDHIAFRDCKMLGTGTAADGSGVQIGASNTATDADKPTSDIVIHGSEISNFGDKNNPGEECGIYPRYYLNRLWVLDSNIHDNAEDGLGGSHDGKRTATYYYVGRNQIHDNLSNALDIKGYGKGVIISENNIYGQFDVWVDGEHKSSDQGSVCVFHYSGNSGGPGSWKNFPEDVSFLFNTVKDGRFQIYTSRCGRLRIIGNAFYNERFEPTDYTNPVSTIFISGVSDDTWIVNNTIYDCDAGIRVADNPLAYNPATTYYRADSVSYNNATYVCIEDNSDAGISGIAPSDSSHWKTIRVQIWGNVIAQRNVKDNCDIKLDSSAFANNSVDLDYNLPYNASWGEAYNYGDSVQRSLLWMKANTNKEAHSLNSNPLLADPPTDFTLQSKSPAVDASTAGTRTTAYADFVANYGISIELDRAGAERPAGKAWDIGAYEYSGSQEPKAPVGLTIGP